MLYYAIIPANATTSAIRYCHYFAFAGHTALRLLLADIIFSELPLLLAAVAVTVSLYYAALIIMPFHYY